MLNQKLSTEQINQLIENDKILQFTEQELVFLVGVVNGVKCTPETLLDNVIGESEYIQIPPTLWEKLKNLNDSDLIDLHSKLYEFWNVPDNHIPCTVTRLRQVNLL